MEKTYDLKFIERKWANYWKKNQLSRPSGSGNSYCMMLPPPNVTGTLHMGHGFQQTLMDILVRYHRMRGDQTLWQGGVDHAGIATQIVVEQQLAQKGFNRHELGRKSFIDRVWEWHDRSGNKIIRQMHRLGLSIDWSRKRFSMDKGFSQATTEAFIRLYHDGLIYRGKRLVNWDPILKTAISDLEVITEEINGALWYIRYPLADGTGHLTVTTTRPETLLGDVAVAVHPDDDRYQNHIGKEVHLPLTNHTVPIITDTAVNREFGTGGVKITPAHDFGDYEMAQRHQLPLINIFTPDGRLNENVPKPYQGLDRFDARKKIVVALEKEYLIEKTEPHCISIPRGERSGAIIEPFLTDQWFLKMKLISEPAMAVIQSEKLKLIPATWEKTYVQWISNIQDWCISRQLWWGHRLPVWYDEEKNYYVGRSQKEIRKKYHLGIEIKLQRDTDVLDTWFSASLWPFATLGWPDKTQIYETFYPTQALVTGFDIIFFWVVRMVMMGLKLTGKNPFHEVYIHGLIRDSQGKKMSKSKGNVIDPIDIIDGISLEKLVEKRTHSLLQPKMAQSIEKLTRKEFPKGIASYGADALRFTFCALATSTGRDINFDMTRIRGYRNFCNKIWNAARFVVMNTKRKDLNSEKPFTYNIVDRWIRSRLQKAIKETIKALTHYRFDLLAQILYEFVWNEYCDWYVEFSKCILYNEHAKPHQQCSTRITLLEILETLLRLLHPIMPFITEEIWHTVAPLIEKSGNSIMTEPYPEFNKSELDNEANTEIEWLKNIITAIRTLRAELNISPAKNITVFFKKGEENDKKRLQKTDQYIKSLGKVTRWQWTDNDELLPLSATNIVGNLEIHLPLAALVQKEIELARLKKEITKLQRKKENSLKKLDNCNYIKKAPKEILEKERLLLETTQKTLMKLKLQYAKTQNL